MARFSYPDVGRYGLGHSLFAWAHAHVWAAQHDAEVLPAIWLRVRIGPWLRNERDKRNYFVLFRPPSLGAQLRRAWLLATRRRLTSSLDRDGGTAPAANAVHVFAMPMSLDTQAVFDAIRAYHALVAGALRAAVRPRFLPRPAPAPFIAIHVRRGDFTVAVSQSALGGGLKNAQIPIDWYCGTLTAVRRALGSDIAAIVFSDGSDSDIRPLLDMPNVRRSESLSAVSDMLDISQASLLIGSGSNFSLWGSFLGQVPRVSYPGQTIARVLSEAHLEIEHDGAEPSAALTALVKVPR